MSFMAKIFGSAPANQPSPAQVQQGQQPPAHITNNPGANPPPVATQTTAATAPNGVVPEQQPESPTKQFETLWQPNKVDPNAPKEDAPAVYTNEQFMEAAGKIDFTKLASAEQLQKINAGGTEAMQVMMELLNKTAQTTFGQALAGASKLIDQRVESARKDFNKNIGKTVKAQNVQETLVAQNKNLADPAVAPVVDAIRAQVIEKFPGASEAEITRMAQDYMIAAAKVFNPEKPKEEPKVPANEDWSDLLN